MSSFDDLYADISGNYEILKGNIGNTPIFSKFGDISSKEQQVIDNINEMSKIISCYKVKQYNTDYSDNKIDPIDNYCVAKYRNYTVKELDTSFKNLNSILTTNTLELTNLLGKFHVNRGNIDGSLNVVDGESIEDVLKNYNHLQRDRNKLKTTLSELKSEKGTFSRESELHLDASIYSSILWTTFATGLLYYVFTAL